MDILALDIAKVTGVARGHAGSTPALSVQIFGRRDDDDAETFGRATLWFARLLRDEPPELIAVERPLPVYDSTLLYGLRGIAIGLARAKHVPVIQVPVATWRKFFLGRGDLRGPEAKRRCVKLCAQLKWSAPTTRAGDPDHNAAEAGGLWLYACSQAAPMQTQRCEPLFVGAHQ